MGFPRASPGSKGFSFSLFFSSAERKGDCYWGPESQVCRPVWPCFNIGFLGYITLSPRGLLLIELGWEVCSHRSGWDGCSHRSQSRGGVYSQESVSGRGVVSGVSLGEGCSHRSQSLGLPLPAKVLFLEVNSYAVSCSIAKPCPNIFLLPSVTNKL